MFAKSNFAKGIDAILDAQFEGRLFEVFSIASGKSLSKEMTFTAASDQLEIIAYGAGGVNNGTDIREVK
ncbi:hypothetical protein LCGC14_2168450 [marine sediment metagenome]|uniref:Uncharacterized protein n=1 Tax=marine sediment metagenome TaxID=412755 RepID=A0A0F9DQU7_9ZZZZ